MRTAKLPLILLAAIGLTNLHADPCGMVPPIMLDPSSPELVRVGDQMTYVFFKDGIQDIALRPGFKGKLTDFGMLIPFPKVPDIRKVSDNIFTHLQQAIEPPEVVIDMRPRPLAKPQAAANRRKRDMEELYIGRVTVLKEEAVGMYQVAVLEAADPKALEAWMTAHQYVYPKGMDEVCAEYIEAKWCFVAVKANVGSQPAVEPKPGMRQADPLVDDVTGFEGAVQAMGFRFRIDKPVVPMRLSAFNGGELHNIVYVFSDQAVKIPELPESFVKGKISGEQLYKNMTEPLPVKVIGGTLEQAEKAGYLDMPQYSRDPRPKNGDAYDLLSSDLLAVKTGELTHPFEAREKELLKIGERLGLRGEEVDRLIGEVIAKERLAAAEAVKDSYRGMTLTVIEGDFPREVIAAKNLHFEPYAAKDLALLLDGGEDANSPRGGALVAGSAIAGFALLGWFVICRRVNPKHTLAVLLSCLGAASISQPARADSPQSLIEALSEPETSEAAAASLVAMGEQAVPDLIGEAVEGDDYNRRGWAIACLADIGSKQAVDPLTRVSDDDQAPDLVKMWAGAALMRIRGADAIKDLMRAAAEDSSKQAALAATLLGMRAGAVRPLTTILLGAEDNTDRQQATAWLGALDQRLPGGIVRKVLEESLSYSKEKSNSGVPWKGGALFLPRTQWTTDEAWDLSRHLICWMLWAEDNDQPEVAKQVSNNLRDLSWRNGIGFRQVGSGREWAKALLGKAGHDPNAITAETDTVTVILILQLL